jgi:hypothetical protein
VCANIVPNGMALRIALKTVGLFGIIKTMFLSSKSKGINNLQKTKKYYLLFDNLLVHRALSP